MIKLSDLKNGAIVSINDDGVTREGTVVKTSSEENKVLINNGVQEFWYEPMNLQGVPLDEDRLTRLGFTKEVAENGVKYKKDSFRLAIHQPNDFANLELWWREDRRTFNHPIMVHELQNLYLSMTKVSLDSLQPTNFQQLI